MGNISITFKFELANGDYGRFTIKDVSENATTEDIFALANEMLNKSTKLNGQGLVSLVDCTKSILVQEKLELI